MDVSRKKNTVKMMGNLEVKEQIKAKDLLVEGKLIVNGKNLASEKEPVNHFYIGNPELDGCWKLENNNSLLTFSQKVAGEWVEKQMMS